MLDHDEKVFHHYPNVETRLGVDQARTGLIASAKSLGVVLQEDSLEVLARFHGLQILNVFEVGIDGDAVARWARVANMRLIGYYRSSRPTNTFEMLMSALKEYLPGMFPFAIVWPIRATGLLPLMPRS